MSAVVLEDSLPILCALGRHRAGRRVHWNDGFYFTCCRRCGRDLVRTTYGGWHVPRGARVVWSPRRPANSVSASLVPEQAAAAPSAGAAPVAAPQGAGLPIEEVLRHLKRSGGDGPNDAPPRRSGGRTYIPDFMEDAATDTSWRTNRPEKWPPPSGAGGNATPPRRGARDSDPGAAESRANAGAIGSRRIALATAGAALLILVFLVAGRDRPASPAGEAIVIADVLDCRAAPVSGATRVTQLLRGDRVRLLARKDGWAGIAYGVTRCWAPARQLVAGVPL